MRFARAAHEGSEFSAVVLGAPGEEVVHALRAGTTVLDLAAAGSTAAREAADWARRSSPAVAVADVRLLLPLTPPSVRDFVTFEEHVEGVVRSVSAGPGSDAVVAPEWYPAPTFYFTNPHGLIGAHDDVAVPPGCRLFDFELEVVVVVGAAGADLSPGQAREHVLGSGTCGNGGCLAELWGRAGAQVPPPLAPGDVVRLEVEGIGAVSNRVVAGAQLQDLPAVPPARPRDRRRHRRLPGPGEPGPRCGATRDRVGAGLGFVPCCPCVPPRPPTPEPSRGSTSTPGTRPTRVSCRTACWRP